MRLATVGTALAILVAGASSLSADPVPRAREEAWRSFLERCEGHGRVHRKVKAERRLGEALSRLTEAERDRIRERLRRIELMTKAWAAVEAQARRAVVARQALQVFVPAARALDLSPVMQSLLRLNGLEPARRGGVQGRRVGSML